MKKFNVLVPSNGLEVHEDERGVIADVFFNEDINHVNLITSNPGALRGNHYHPKSVQRILIVEGSLEYWYRDKDGAGFGECVIANLGDLVESPPNEIHALRIGPVGCKFITFTSGPRGGSDYELDTVRTENIIGTVS